MSQYIIQRFSLVTLLSIAGFLVSTCTQNKEQPTSTPAPTRMAPPQVTVLASLPDSSQPKVILLADRPRPKVVNNTKPGKIHSFIDPRTHLPVAPEVQGTGLFTTYTTENGLVLDQLACSRMDKTGVLWFGSWGSGVSKYDGKTFTTYTTTQGLAHNMVRTILEDRKGNLWFGTGGGGVSKYDGKQFTAYTTAQGLANNYVTSIIDDKSGNLWFGTLGGGVSKYDGKTFTTYTTKQGLALNAIWNSLEDKAGNLWFSTDGAGISKYDGQRFTTYTTEQGLASNDVYTILEDKTGNIWFGTTGGGVSKYDGKTFTTYTTKQGLAGNEIISCLKDKDGNLWFGMLHEGGVSKYDGTNFINFTTAQGLANNSISSILEDKSGNIWLSTEGGGVSKYSGGSFTKFTRNQGLSSSTVNEIIEDKRESLWFSTNNGVTHYDGNRFETYTTAQGLANNNVFGSLVDRTGNLWFCTGGGGVTQYNGKQFTTYTTIQGLANGYIYCIIEDRKGNLWFGTMGGEISKYDGKQFTTYTTAQGLADNSVLCLLEDNMGNIWFGTTSGGISTYDGNQFITYTTKQGLASNTVSSIIEDKKGNLWIGTVEGLSRFDGKRFVNFTTAQGLPGNRIWRIILGPDSTLVIGTDQGVGVLTAFTLKQKEAKKIDSISIQNVLTNEDLKNYTLKVEIYNTATGYPIKDVNTLFRDSKGITWIGTSSDKTGLVRFDYSAVHKNQNPPTLVLQTVKINNETVCWNDLLPASGSAEQRKQADSLATPAHVTEEVTALGRALRETERDSLRRTFSGIAFDSVAPWYPIPVNLVLPYRHNSLSFDFNAIETSRNFMVKYQYKLDGYDEDWSSIKAEASATFGNLYEGTYTFKVKARSPEGIWSQPLTYSFTILPPFWRTWWAYLLYALAAGGTIWAFVAYRSRALRRENRILEEKVSLRTNQLQKKSTELETSLTNLKTTQTQLVQKEKMASLGELTAGIAHEIQNPLNFVNNFSELSADIVDELEEEHQKPQRDDELEVELLTDLKDNLTKILHHGNRASSIVKGMLEHARSSTGEVRPTDLNALVDEYLRLAYQGLRAKDKGFNCGLETEFDSSIGEVSLIPQEIGRVLLNLFSNAFYAVHQRQTQSGEDYQPTVMVSTRSGNGQATISVRDNGTGMSDAVKAKIFQPFFTTKPTGQGTGLGLSLSYDIITKGHGGELTVSSQEGQGTEFTITLPASERP